MAEGHEDATETKLGEEDLLLATVVHISSARCRGHKEVATLAHKNVCRELMLDVALHQKTKGDRKFTTLGLDKTLRSVWQVGDYTDIHSKEELWAGVAEEEAKTPLKEDVEGRSTV